MPHDAALTLLPSSPAPHPPFLPFALPLFPHPSAPPAPAHPHAPLSPPPLPAPLCSPAPARPHAPALTPPLSPSLPSRTPPPSLAAPSSSPVFSPLPISSLPPFSPAAAHLLYPFSQYFLYFEFEIATQSQFFYTIFTFHVLYWRYRNKLRTWQPRRGALSLREHPCSRAFPKSPRRQVCAPADAGRGEATLEKQQEVRKSVWVKRQTTN